MNAVTEQQARDRAVILFYSVLTQEEQESWERLGYIEHGPFRITLNSHEILYLHEGHWHNVCCVVPDIRSPDYLPEYDQHLAKLLAARYAPQVLHRIAQADMHYHRMNYHRRLREFPTR